MDSFLENAIFHNLNEVAGAQLYFDALNGMGDISKQNKYVFFLLASNAMKNDMISHLIRVLDKSSGTSSFWYIYKKEKIFIDEYVKEHNINFSIIEEISDKKRLHHIRNKAHFHTDKQYAYNPNQAWLEAGISSKNVKDVLESLLKILAAIFEREKGFKFKRPLYDGRESGRIYLEVNNKNLGDIEPP